MRRLLLLVVALGSLASPALAATSFTDIEDEVMCVSCNVPLNIAESPQADSEREEIRRLIAQGKTKQEVKDSLVDQYGPRVLALPKDDGFGIAVYLVPIAVVVALIGLLIFLLPKWRARGAAAEPEIAPTLSIADQRRLQADLDQFDS